MDPTPRPGSSTLLFIMQARRLLCNRNCDVHARKERNPFFVDILKEIQQDITAISSNLYLLHDYWNISLYVQISVLKNLMFGYNYLDTCLNLYM